MPERLSDFFKKNPVSYVQYMVDADIRRYQGQPDVPYEIACFLLGVLDGESLDLENLETMLTVQLGEPIQFPNVRECIPTVNEMMTQRKRYASEIKDVKGFLSRLAE